MGNDFSVNEVFSTSWAAIKKYPGILIGGLVIFLLIYYGVSYGITLLFMFGGLAMNIEEMMGELQGGDPSALIGWYATSMLVMYAIIIPLATYLQLGYCNLTLKAVKFDAPDFPDMFPNGSKYLKFLGSAIIIMIVSSVGLVPMIISVVYLVTSAISGGEPTVAFIIAYIMSIGFALVWSLFLYTIWGFCIFGILEKDLGPVEALKYSATITKGRRWKIFWTIVLLGIVAMAGIIACCVGILFTIPLGLLGFATIYIKISGWKDEPGQEKTITPRPGIAPPEIGGTTGPVPLS